MLVKNTNGQYANEGWSTCVLHSADTWRFDYPKIAQLSLDTPEPFMQCNINYSEIIVQLRLGLLWQ